MKLVQASNDPDKILTTKTAEVKPEEVIEIYAKLRAGITLNPNLVGLAANQIGIGKAVCLVQTEKEWLLMVNPVIKWSSTEESEMVEGCGSLRIPEEEYYLVSRPREIRVEYWDKNFEHRERELTDYDARIAQHEIDHLNGILISDHGTRYVHPQ